MMQVPRGARSAVIRQVLTGSLIVIAPTMKRANAAALNTVCILCKVFIGAKPLCIACLEEGEESLLPDTRRLRALEAFWHLMDSLGL